MKIFELLRKQLHNKGHLLLHLKRVFDFKCSDVIVSVHDTTNKVLSSSSNYVVDVVM